MQGYVALLKDFRNTRVEEIVAKLRASYPCAEASQVASWHTLILDAQSAEAINELPDDTVIAIEYSLPTEGMAIDMIVAGRNAENQKVAFIVESKQWNDAFIGQLKFSAYREDGKELHPQVQVSRHRLSFCDYLDVGQEYTVHPYVFIRNCSRHAIDIIQSSNPRPNQTLNVTVTNRINDVFSRALNEIVSAIPEDATALIEAEYCPSKDIVKAMESIVTKDEPFILTEEQRETVAKVKQAISNGKKIIRITGAAGSGKTAILLNLYVEYLNEVGTTTRPIFISGAQNTAYYRSVYPQVEASFNYSFSLDRMVAKTKGSLYVIMMDEAQHNQQGIITNMVNRGATLILCYDPSQIINADNSIAELKGLETREDFVTIELQSSVRFNGSQVAEKNIKNYLRGNNDFESDDAFDFRTFTDFSEFQTAVVDTIRSQPNASVAVAGLLSNDSDDYTYEGNPKSILFTKWGNKTECEWMPYIGSKDYLNKNDGKLWVGTWWLPGLDVDYVAVIVGGDLLRTPSGVIAVPEKAKHYRMMVSIAEQMKLPSSLILEKKVFGKVGTDYFRSSKKITEFINQPGNEEIKKQYIDLFSKLLRNNYYIMMTRGRKGCFVYFANNEEV